jgi:beta-galactosidase/beta-glucuronidase
MVFFVATLKAMVENRRFGPADNYDKHHAAPPVNITQIAVDVVTMVRTFRNSPSVVLWSLCNEEGCFEHPDTNLPGLSVGAYMKQLIAAHDGTRAVMAAMNDGMYFAPENVRCSFFDRNVHSRVPLVPTPARVTQTCV